MYDFQIKTFRFSGAANRLSVAQCSPVFTVQCTLTVHCTVYIVQMLQLNKCYTDWRKLLEGSFQSQAICKGTSLKSLRLRELLTFGYIWLPIITIGYLSLPLVTFRYLSLPLITFGYLSLPLVTFGYLSLLSFPFFTFPYLSLALPDLYLP